MGKHAFVLGGTGQIGSAIAERLLKAGWRVSVASRGSRDIPERLRTKGAVNVRLDRDHPGALARALGNGTDALIDVVGYGPSHARQLLEVQQSVGAIVAISSSSVYRDNEDRTLDEAAKNGFPDFAGPISEAQPTVDPGEATYSTRKVALERTLLDEANVPITILRPGAVYGLGSVHPREWWFVKRMLDRRAVIPLAYEGRSRFHTSSVINIAELINIALGLPGLRILNAADGHALNVAEIGAAIAGHMEFEGKLMPLSGSEFPAQIGRTPWSVPRPFVLDTSAATQLGYAPVANYADTVGSVCEELRSINLAADWRAAFPVLAGYPYDQFNYATEDAFWASV